jgi:hypothetical protein
MSAHLKRFLDRRALPGETVVLSIPAWIGNKSGVLVATDRRVAFCHGGIIGDVFRSVDLADVTGVWESSEFGRRKLDVRAGSVALEVSTVVKERAVNSFVAAVDAGRRAIADGKEPLEAMRAAGVVAPLETGKAPRSVLVSLLTLPVTAFLALNACLLVAGLGGSRTTGGVVAFCVVALAMAAAFLRPGTRIARLATVGTRFRAAAVLAVAALGLVPTPAPKEGSPGGQATLAAASPAQAEGQPTAPPVTAAVTPPEVPLQSQPPVQPGERPDAMRQPSALCSLLRPVGINLGGWRTSRAASGGWVCGDTGRWVDIGAPGLAGNPTNLTYFTFGSGPARLDRLVLKLNIFNQATEREGKDRLVRASELIAAHFGIELPSGFAGAVGRERSRMLREPPTGPRRLVLSSTQRDLVVELGVEQSRITTIVVVFRSQHESGIWGL